VSVNPTIVMARSLAASAERMEASFRRAALASGLTVLEPESKVMSELNLRRPFALSNEKRPGYLSLRSSMALATGAGTTG
jgi:hypothetical protein